MTAFYTAERMALSVENSDHIRSLYIPKSALGFVSDSPEVIEEAVDTAMKLQTPAWNANVDRVIGSGSTSVVYELSSNDGLAVKVSSSDTMKQNWKDETNRGPNNLVIDSRFMDRLGAYFDSVPEHGFSVPRQTAALKVKKGHTGTGFVYAQVMEKLPSESLVKLGKYREDSEDASKESLDALGERFDRVFAGTVLRHAITDIVINHGGGKEYSDGNIFVEKDKPIETSQIHLIDVIEQSRPRRLAAALLGRLPLVATSGDVQAEELPS